MLKICVPPSAETAYVTFDFARPATATGKKRYVTNRWHKAVTSTTALNCGTLSAPSTDPRCATVFPGPDPTEQAVDIPSGSMTLTYGVRVWEDNYDGTLTEVTQCMGCADTATAGVVRVTVALPPRAVGADTHARKFYVAPVVKGLTPLRPEGLDVSDYTLGGVRLTGYMTMTRTGCTRMNVSPTTEVLTCAERGTLTEHTALSAINGTPSLEYSAAVSQLSLRSSLDGAAPVLMPHLQDAARNFSGVSWSTSEQPLPPIP